METVFAKAKIYHIVELKVAQEKEFRGLKYRAPISNMGNSIFAERLKGKRIFLFAKKTNCSPDDAFQLKCNAYLVVPKHPTKNVHKHPNKKSIERISV